MSSDMSGDYNSDEITSDISAVIEKLGWTEFSVLGHSMTGMVAQKLMARLKGSVQKVVATKPILASGFGLDAVTFEFFQSMPSNDDAFKGGMHALTSGKYNEGWAISKLKQNRKSVNPQAMEAYATMWSKEDFSAEIQGNNTPILVIFGAHDNEGLRAEANAEKFKGWFPNYFEIIMDTGHYPMIEAPVAYAKIVQDYLLD